MEDFFIYAYVSSISACVVLIIMLLFTDTVSKNYRRAKKYLFILLGISVLQCIGYIFFPYSTLVNSEELLHIYPMASIVFKSMLSYLVLLSIMNVLGTKKNVIFKIYAAPVFLILFYFLARIFTDDTHINSISEISLNLVVIIKLLIFVSLGIAFVSAFIMIYKSYLNYINSIDNYYADSESLKLRKMMYTGIFYFVIGILGFICNIVSIHDMELFFHVSIIVLYITFVVMLINEQKTVEKVEKSMMMNVAAIDESETLNEEDYIEEVALKINEWLANGNKQFLKQGISISEVADEMKLNKRVLSTFINKHYKMNFNTWINTLRVDEVCKYLKENYSFTEIADMTGFTDLSSMGKIFKKMKGKTLTEYSKHSRINRV